MAMDLKDIFVGTFLVKSIGTILAYKESQQMSELKEAQIDAVREIQRIKSDGQKRDLIQKAHRERAARAVMSAAGGSADSSTAVSNLVASETDLITKLEQLDTEFINTMKYYDIQELQADFAKDSPLDLALGLTGGALSSYAQYYTASELSKKQTLDTVKGPGEANLSVTTRSLNLPDTSIFEEDIA